MSDLSVMIELNSIISTNTNIFYIAVFLATRLEWLLSAIFLIYMWYSKSEETDHQYHVSRQEETYSLYRQITLLTFLAMVISFLAALSIGHALGRTHPFEEQEISIAMADGDWTNATKNLDSFNSFPAIQMASWAALSVGVYHFSRRVGIVAVWLGIITGIAQIAVGIHYPTDVISGFFLGGSISIVIFHFRDHLVWYTHPVMLFFELAPALLYPVALLLMVDITQQLVWFFDIVGFVFNVQI